MNVREQKDAYPFDCTGISSKEEKYVQMGDRDYSSEQKVIQRTEQKGKIILKEM